MKISPYVQTSSPWVDRTCFAFRNLSGQMIHAISYPLSEQSAGQSRVETLKSDKAADLCSHNHASRTNSTWTQHVRASEPVRTITAIHLEDITVKKKRGQSTSTWHRHCHNISELNSFFLTRSFMTVQELSNFKLGTPLSASSFASN